MTMFLRRLRRADRPGCLLAVDLRVAALAYGMDTNTKEYLNA